MQGKCTLEGKYLIFSAKMCHIFNQITFPNNLLDTLALICYIYLYFWSKLTLLPNQIMYNERGLAQ